MKKWEYFYFQTEYHTYLSCYTGRSKEKVVFNPEDKAQIADIYRYLDRLGAEGWEMLAVIDDSPLGITQYHFKRPVE